MEWVELLFSFIEKQTGHLVTLIVAFAWPAVVAFLFLTQRVSIAALIDRIKTLSLGKDGLKVDADLKANTETIAQAKVVQLLKPVVHNVGVEEAAHAVDEADAHVDPPAFEAHMDFEPEHAVPSTNTDELVAAAKYIHDYHRFGAYMEASSILKTKPDVVIERAWAEVEKQLFRLVQQKERPSSTLVTGNHLLQLAIQEHLLDRKLLEAIEGLLNIRNETVSAIMGWQPTREQAAQFVENAGEVLQLLEPYMQVGYKGGKKD